MEKETKKSKAEGEKRKRKSSHRNDEKKSRGKQKKKDNTVENSEEVNKSKEKETESPSASRPSSPEPNCSICLGDLQNKSFTDSCFHMFCFVCLKEWSKVKAECPLCKQKFQNIIYNVKSYDKYDRYNIAEEEANRSWECDRRFRYRTTLTFERRLTFAPEHDYHQPIARPSRVTTRSHWQRYRQPSTSEFRRRIYANGMQATEVTDRRLRVRDVSPAFFRRNPATTHRLVPWLNRELNSLLHNQSHNVQTVIEIIMGLIKSFSIDSEEFYQHVYPYVGRYTRHFMHEFLCFAKSPYNMATYDQHVIYQPGTLTVNSDSNESSIDLEDNDFVDEVIDLEGENSNVREPPPERRGHTFDDDLSPLLQTVRDIFEERPGSSLNLPLSMSGWDSPTPGPSWFNLAADLEIPLSSITGTVPVVGNRESSPIDIDSSTDTDSDSTESVSSNGSDIVFVKMDKPWDDRSPIMLSSGSDTDENKISLDFINKHYAKRKHQKKKDHKKHKEHRKRKDSGDTDTTKERSKHKKHRRHHSSDKSERRSHSSSKQRDSGRSRSSSKHGDSILSLKSSDNSEKSVHKEKHKKHKKHKKHEHHKKSSSMKKLQSVVVLPDNRTVMRSSASTESVFSSASTISEPKSALSSTNMSFAENISYKKHSSGHKKSGKLTDIVPKLLEKSRDMLDSKRNDNGEHFESKDTKNSKSKESSVQIENSDLVLSLQNSRRCLKCGLLYIPELLDNFDICFTCKKRKVCETESRSLSDVIHELNRQKLNVHSTSNDITFGSETQTKRTDNVVIQEGSESSLRPALNQVDLTSIDSPLFGTSDSDNDECELVLQEKHKNQSYQELQIHHSYQPPNTDTQNRSSVMSNPLNIEFSNPSTPMKGLSQTSVKTGSSGSPPPWILEVSNPPTPSAGHWPGYMSPNYSPEYPSLESLFPNMLPSSYSNTVSHNGNRQTSSTHGSVNSPMSCSSISRNPVIKKPENPITIDLENDFVDLESIDKNHCENVGNMSVSSTENICSSDSNQSGNLHDLNIITTDAENYSKEINEENYPFKCQTNRDLKQNDCQSDKVDRMDTEYSDGEREQLSVNFDDSFNKNTCFSLPTNLKESETELAVSADVDMTDSDEHTKELKSVSYDDRTTEDGENNEHSDKTLYSDEVDCLNVGHRSGPFCRSVPQSLEEKLAGLTDFSPSVLQRINAENRLSFHSIISGMVHNKSKNTDDSVEGQSSMPSDTEVDLVSKSKCSNSLFVSSSNIQMDSSNENSNSMDKFVMQNNSHGPFSVAMDSVESGENLDDMFNDNSNCVSLKSQVRSGNVESDDMENVDKTCDLSKDHRNDFPQFSFEKEDAVLGLDASKDDSELNSSRTPATSSDIGQFSPCNQIEGFAANEEVCSSNDPISDNCNDDRSTDDSDKNEAVTNTSDDTENFIASHQTEFSSESDLENCLSHDSEYDNSPTVEYRIDILHSDKALSENLANILENSDSLDSN